MNKLITSLKTILLILMTAVTCTAFCGCGLVSCQGGGFGFGSCQGRKGGTVDTGGGTPEPKIEEPVDESVVRVYVRSFDYNGWYSKTNPSLTLEKEGQYIGRSYQDAFPNAIVKVSTDAISRQELYDEIDEFFKDADENDVCHISLSGHGSTNGYIFLHTGDGTLLSDITKNHVENIKGKIYLSVSACFAGRYLDSRYGGNLRDDFRSRITAEEGKFNILMSGVNESTYTPNAEGPTADACGKWAEALQIESGDNGISTIKGDMNGDGKLTFEEIYLYGITKPHSYESMRYPKNDDTVILSIPKYNVVFNACDGKFSNGSDVSVTLADKGKTVKMTPVVNRDGAVFDGWYTKPEGGEKIEFPLTMNGNVTAWAHWKKDGKPYNSHPLQNWDVIRIPLNNGSYTDFLVIDKEHTCNIANQKTMKCESDTGMFLISKGNASKIKIYDNFEDACDWNKSNIKKWFDVYYNQLPKAIRNALYDTTITVPNGTETDKLFILTKEEIQACFPKDKINANMTSQWWRRWTSSDPDGYPFMTKGGGAQLLVKSKSNMSAATYGFCPVLNLNFTENDLVYDYENEVFTFKTLKDYKTEFEPVDKQYYVKVNGEIVYTATGGAKAACDYMNTMATVTFTIDSPIYYTYMGNLRTIMHVGQYRGLPYANTYDRNFYYIDRPQDAFAEGEDKVRGLECSSAVGWALRIGMGATGDELLENVSEGNIYDCRNFVADGLHDGEGEMRTIGGSGRLQYKDYMTCVGDYGEYVNDGNPNTEFIIKGILETANYASGTIYDNIYALIRPGDALVRHYIPPDAGQNMVKSHAQLCTGVELFYDAQGNLDIENSKIYFTDISAPHNSIVNSTGEYTAWTTDDTQKANWMTLKYMVTEGYVIPVRINEWFD